MYYNSNLVPIMRFIMIVFIKKRYLHFENLNVHFMSHRILTNFVSTQWPEIFLSHKVFIDILTICCMQIEMLALQWVMHLLSCLICYRITWFLLSWCEDMAWKVDGRAHTLVATSLLLVLKDLATYIKSIMYSWLYLTGLKLGQMNWPGWPTDINPLIQKIT